MPGQSLTIRPSGLVCSSDPAIFADDNEGESCANSRCAGELHGMHHAATAPRPRTARSSLKPLQIRGCVRAALRVLVLAASTAQAQSPPPGADQSALETLPSVSDSASALDSREETAAAEVTSESEDPPFGGPLFERAKLSGDWSGLRTDLHESGVTLDVSSTQYYQGVARGGLRQAFLYGGRNDYFLNFDGEGHGLWEGASVTLHGETRYGETVSSIGGTLLSPNLLLSLPTPEGAVTALTGVTLTQSITEDFLIFGGKINTFDDSPQPLTEAGSLTGFQNTALLYNPVLARTVPYSTFGAGFAFLRDDETILSATVFDTNDSPTTSGFDTFFDNGVTIYGEFNIPTQLFDRPGNHSVYGTYSTGKYTNLTPSAYLDPIEGLVNVAPPRTGSWSIAYGFDQALFVSPGDPERMWGVFGNIGVADSNPSPVRWFTSAGISGASPILSRTADTFGFAYFYMGLSEPLKNRKPALFPLRDEHGFEVYYNIAVTSWCQVTPDMQAISPFRDGVNAALIFGIRVNLTF
jgi:porin